MTLINLQGHFRYYERLRCLYLKYNIYRVVPPYLHLATSEM